MPRVSNHESPYVAILRDAAKTPLLRMRTAQEPRRSAPATAALIATDSASLLCSTISSTSSSRLIWAASPVSSPCSASMTTPCTAVQIFRACRSRKNPAAGASSASSTDRRFPSPHVCSSLPFATAGHRSRREHQPVDAVAAKTEIQRGLRDARQLRLFRWLADRLPQHGVELAEGFRGNRLQQRLAVGKMPVGRRLRDAELLRQRLEADGFRAALFGFGKSGLNQRVPEIAMVVGVEQACGLIEAASAIPDFSLDSTRAARM